MSSVLLVTDTVYECECVHVCMCAHKVYTARLLFVDYNVYRA